MPGRILRFVTSGALVGAAILVALLISSQEAEARVFIGFGFGFPGFIGPPIYAPPPPLVVYRPSVVYAPPPPPVYRPAPVVYEPPPPPVKHSRRPVRHYRPCRCYGS